MRTATHLLILILAATAGCSSMTDVDAPDVVDPGSLDNPAGATARYAGAIVDFARAFSAQASETGLMSDEFRAVSGGVSVSDRRATSVDLSKYPFLNFSVARIAGLRGISTLKRFAPTPPARIGELYALVGFIETMFAENLCSPIPLAALTDGVPTASSSYTRDALITDALAMFDSAAAYATSSDPVTNLTRVGRARALLLKGDLDGAATAAAAVPAAFEYAVAYSSTTTTQTNSLYNDIAVARAVSVADREGGNGLPFVLGSDRRVSPQALGTSQSGLPVIGFGKNTGLGAAIVLASGTEAALIGAEAALKRGDIATWAAALNSLRRTIGTPALPVLTADSTTTATATLRLDVMYKERAFWLFGTGHRHGDLRRLIRQYGRGMEATFPTGDYVQSPGTRYGTDVSFVLPRGEEPNRSYTGCTDRGA